MGRAVVGHVLCLSGGGAHFVGSASFSPAQNNV